MAPSFRGVPGPAAADHHDLHVDPTPAPDAAANGAAQAALAGPAANGGARARNTGPAQRGAVAAGNVLGALARNVRMKLTDEEADPGDDAVHHGIDGSDAAGRPWCELGLGAASSVAPMRDGAGKAGPGVAGAAAGRAKSARASGDRSAVAVGTAARIEAVRAGAPVRRAEAPRGWTVLGIVGWTLELATVVMLGAALWVLVLALVRAVDEAPGSQRDNGCERAPQSCKK